MTEHRYRNTTEALPHLADHVLGAGDEVGSRGGSRTLEVLHQHIVLERPYEREVLTPGRGASIVAQIAETMWILAGRNDIDFLLPYLPRAADFSDDGKTWRGGYGPRIRRWDDGEILSTEIDQLRYVVETLREDPLSRRAVISIYNPGIDSAPGKDVPCNNWLAFSSRLGKLDLHVATRSNDLIWGWSGINAFEWSVLQEVVAGLLGIEVGELHFSINSLHVYDRHWQKASRIAEYKLSEGARRLHAVPEYGSPVRFDATKVDRDLETFDTELGRLFVLEEALRSDDGDDEYAKRIDAISEPMLHSWGAVLAWYWTGDESYLNAVRGTRLAAAVFAMPDSLKPLKRVDTTEPVAPTEFLKHERQELRLEPVFELVDTSEPVAPADAINDRPLPPAIAGSSELHVSPGFPAKHVDRSEAAFAAFVYDLHAGKHRVYGDSWKKRGELLGILANVARKIDRLGEAGGGDTAADTVIDLFVYLAKYTRWLQERGADRGVAPFDEEAFVGIVLNKERDDHAVNLARVLEVSNAELSEHIKRTFADLEQIAQTPGTSLLARRSRVSEMITPAYVLAYRLWRDEQ